MPGGPVRVAVVGGGIAGLAAAHRLVELGAERRAAVEVTLLEARPRLGGTIATEHRGGYLIEAGPDSFLTDKPWALALCHRLGLTDQLVRTRETDRRTFVVHRGRLCPLPDAFLLLAPARLGPMLVSPLFSWSGKMRMAMDLILPRGPARKDESLAGFVRRRFGSEVLDRVAQPMVAGIYTADPETLSLAATMPRFLEMERRHRSVILALMRNRQRLEAEGRAGAGAGAGSEIGSQGGTGRGDGDGGEGPAERHSSGPRWSLFVTLADGMGTLVTAIASRLPPRTLRLGARAVSLARTKTAAATGAAAGPRPAEAQAPGRPDRYLIGLDDASSLEADAVIVATEAHHAAALARGVDPDLAALLDGIPYASSATVTLGYRREEISHPLDGFGFVVPQTERRSVLACSFSSVKFPGRAPAGGVLLRAFLGGTPDTGMAAREDAALAEIVTKDLGGLLGITAAPRLVRVHRHPAAMPQYHVGHLDRVAAIDVRAAQHPGLAFAGSAYRGIGIPDCVRSGEEAAERVLTPCVGGANV